MTNKHLKLSHGGPTPKEVKKAGFPRLSVYVHLSIFGETKYKTAKVRAYPLSENGLPVVDEPDIEDLMHEVDEFNRDPKKGWLDLLSVNEERKVGNYKASMEILKKRLQESKETMKKIKEMFND